MIFGLDLLGLLYDRMNGCDEAFFRTAANNGVRSIRLFVGARDKMRPGDYTPAFWQRFDDACKWAAKYQIELIFCAGYYRAYHDIGWNHENFIKLIDDIISRAEKHATLKWRISPLNEPMHAPRLFGVTDGVRYSNGSHNHRFVYQQVLPDTWRDDTGRMRMLELGGWYAWLRNNLADRVGVDKITGCVNYDPRFQQDPMRYPSTSDRVLGGLIGELEGWSAQETRAALKQVTSEWHGVTLVSDLFHVERVWSVFARARTARNLFFTNDGSSMGEPHGVGVKHPSTGKIVYRSSNSAELKSLLAALDRIDREGVRLAKIDLDQTYTLDQLCSGAARHRFSIIYHDLPREIFKGYVPQVAEWDLDLGLLDWQRIRSALPKEYAAKWCDRFPEPVEDDPIEDPPPDDEDTQPIEIPEEKMTNAWTKLIPRWRWSWPFLLVNVKGFWQAATALDRVAFCSLALHSLEALVLLGIIIF